MGRVLYWMSRDRDRVSGPRRGQGHPSVDLLAGTVTDLQCPMYIGPYPDPGETVEGVVMAYSGRGRHIPALRGMRDVTITVYLRAEELRR